MTDRAESAPGLPAGLQRIVAERSTLLLLVALVAVWAFVALRAMPHPNWNDRGIFITVAERLLAGERLYSGVFDNKDPLFYYFVAAQLSLGRWFEFAAELALVLACATSGYVLASAVAGERAAFIVGFIGIPLVVTGYFYLPGYTHLPGIALCLGSYALALRQRPLLAGALLGVLVFAKLPMVPVGLAIVIAATWTDRRAILRIAAAATGVAAVIAVVLAWRGEFLPYLQMLAGNISYSQGERLAPFAGYGPILDHFIIVWDDRVAVMLLGVVGCLAVAFSTALALPERTARDRLLLHATTAGLALAASLVVLGATGLWAHHNQILYLSAVLSLIAAAPLIERSLPQLGGGIALTLVLVAALLLAGLPQQEQPREVERRWTFERTLSPEAARLLAAAPSGNYARLGSSGDRAHAIGLDAWQLACPRFHQYWFDAPETLGDVLACAATAPTLIVAESLAEIAGKERWNTYVGDVEALIAQSYRCDADSGLRICTRKER